MKKTDKGKQQALEEIAQRAEKEYDKLSGAQKDVISAAFFGLMSQTKWAATETGMSHESILILFWFWLYQNLTFGQSGGEKSESEKAGFVLKPKNGLLQ